MKYRTTNLDAISQPNVSNLTLIETLLQDAFLTNYKIGLGIIEEIIPNENYKLISVKCRPAVQHQLGVTEKGVPIFKDYAPTYARLIQWGNNSQPITTKVLENQLCLLLYTDRPFDNVWTQEPSEETGLITTQPLATYRAHNMGDALCIPFSHDVALTDITTIKDDVRIEGDLTVTGNLIVSGNITAAHIEAQDGFTGTKVANESITFKGGICLS